MKSIGIDIGGTNLRGVVLDDSGEILASDRHPLASDRSPEGVIQQLLELCDRLEAETGGGVERRGVGLAAWIDSSSGIVHQAPNLGWRDVPFQLLLSGRSGQHFSVMNDLSAVTWGEWRLGSGRGAKDLLCVFVGSGLGSGMVLDGKLYQGSTGLAGELGHVTVVEEGEPCGCGRKGCLEAYTGGRYIEARARRQAEAGAYPELLEQAGGQSAAITCASIEALYRQGEPEAVRLWTEAAGWLARGLTMALELLNPEKLVLGGGVMAGCRGYQALALEALHEQCPRSIMSCCRVVPPGLGDFAGAVGAAFFAQERGELETPA